MNTSQKSSTPKFSDNASFKLLKRFALPALLILGFFLYLLIGSSDASLRDAIKAAFDGDYANADFRIIFYIRLPRALAAILAGAALAVSGVIIQAVLQNPMAAPNIIGVNAGGGFAAILIIAIFPAAIALLPIAAFLGALASCIIIYGISRVTGASRITITLVGIAISSILTAGINTLKTIFPDSVYDANFFLVGGLSGIGFSTLSPAAYMIIIGLAAAILTAREIDVLSLGEDTAKSLGLRVERWRFILLIIAAILAGSAVSFAGLLGFVGLIVPHIMRRFIKSGHRMLIPACALFGAVFLLYTDMVSRVIFAPYELPVGILLSLIGGPFFILLILLYRRADHDKM